MRADTWMCVGPLRIEPGSLDARDSFLHHPLREDAAENRASVADR